MKSLNNVVVIGQFKLQNALSPFVDELAMPDINRAINDKLANEGIASFKFLIRIYSARVTIEIYRLDDSLVDKVHLKISQNKRIYLPFKNPPKVGISLQHFEKSFRPGVFDVSDECVNKVLEFIDSWKHLTKAKLKHFKFEPRIKEDKMIIKVYKDYKDYDVFQCNV